MENSLLEDYKKWLTKSGIALASVGTYCSCLNDKYNGSKWTYCDIIIALISREDFIFLNTVFEKWKDEIQNKNNITQKTKKNRYQYVSKFKKYTEEIKSTENINIDNELTGYLNEVIQQLGKPQFDGMDSLIGEIGVDRFIKTAIESSYFFHQDIVKDRFKQICEYIKDNKEVDEAFKDIANDKCASKKCIPARFSKSQQTHDEKEGKAYYVGNGLKIRIYQENYRADDKDLYGGGNGNARVCKLIKDLTGYNLGATKEEKSFRNYIISHIWGEATDPRYFTNLWNIAIVPAWANHLLDKDESGTLAASFLNAIKAVICNLYINFNNWKWGEIHMVAPSYQSPFDEKQEFTVNIIKGKGDTDQYGKIDKKKVAI